MLPFQVRMLRRVVMLALTLACCSTALASAQTPTTAVLNGTVHSEAGAPLADASVTVSGPATASAQTDAAGAFTLTVVPGVYRVTVSRAGYTTAVQNDVAVAAGQTLPLSVSLAQPNLSSLQTIGRTSTVARGSGGAINTGTATTTFVPAQSFRNLANPQINAVLERVPELNLEHMGSQPDTTIVLNGAQPYETQVLIDGHPVALGQYGVWSTQFFPSFLIGGAEAQPGAGNTTPFANIAVAGTVNLLTPAFTRRPSAEVVVGTDSYSSQYSHVLASGSASRLSWVVGAGYGSVNGPYYQTRRCAVTPADGTATNLPGSTGIVQFCDDASGSLFQKGELLKLHYDFTPTTSLEASYVGAHGGYLPQGASYGAFLGQTTITACNPAPAGTPPTVCTNPSASYLIGSTIPAYAWYPGSNVYYDQPMFSAQLRTQIGNDTLLLRPYAGNIQPDVVDGSNESQYPSYFGPAPGTPGYQPPTCPSGTPISSCASVAAGGGNAFEQSCGLASSFGFTQLNSPRNTIQVVNGQEECFQAPFSEYETDKLYGATASYIHPFGENLLQLTYDYHGTDTFAYYNSPQNVAVPDSTERYTTFSLVGSLHPRRNLTAQIGLYDTTWKLFGQQPLLDASGAPVTDASGNAILRGLNRSITRFDPHAALVFRPSADVAYRFAYGTSETFPYAGQVTGLPFFQPYSVSSGASFLLVKNPYLEPERSIGFTLGADKRFRNGATLALDLQNTVVHGVFEPLSTVKIVTVSGTTYPAYTTLPVNAARLRSQLVTLKYDYAPRLGLGFNLAAAAERSIADNIPGATLPANNVQICGNGLSNPNNPVCIPYLKAYGQLTYSGRGGTFASLGVNYEGKNNPFYQAPFAQLDLTVRRPITETLEFQTSVENLLNTNAYQGLPMPNVGTPIVQDSPGGQTSYVPYLIPLLPRTVRVQLRYHVGR